MPFKKINIKEEIEKQREISLEFRKAWDNSHTKHESVDQNTTSPKGSSWDDLEKQLFTSQEIAESKVRVSNILSK